MLLNLNQIWCLAVADYYPYLFNPNLPDDFTKVVEGYLKGFNFILENLNQRFTAENILELHGECLAGSTNYQEMQKQLNELVVQNKISEKDRNTLICENAFRATPIETGVPLYPYGKNSNATPDGRKELDKELPTSNFHSANTAQ